MEKAQDKKESVEEYVRRIVTPIFDKVLQETNKNRVSVGSVRSKNCVYNLHNYRLYIDFNKQTFNPSPFIKPTPRGSVRGSVVTTYKIVNSKEYRFEDFLGCTITVKKKQIEIRNHIESDRKYLIPISTDAKSEFFKIVDKKEKECLLVLKEFIKIYGGSSQFKILNRWGHNKIWHEDFIDLIPLKAKWNNKASMKLYNENNVEFPDVALASNYIESQAMESKADNVMDELYKIKETVSGVLEINASTSRTLNEFVNKFMPLQTDFAINIRSHTSVIKDMAKAFKKFNRLLSSKQKKIDDFR